MNEPADWIAHTRAFWESCLEWLDHYLETPKEE